MNVFSAPQKKRQVLDKRVVLPETVRAGTSTYTDGGWAGTLYNATLTGLAPSTEYYYACRVVARDHVDLAMLNPLVFDLTAEFSFRTAPPVGSAEGINPGEGLQIYAVADLGENEGKAHTSLHNCITLCM